MSAIGRMVGITGTQSPGPFADTIVRVALLPYNPVSTVIVQGCCIGMDTCVALIARELGFLVWGIVPANRYKVDQRALDASHHLIYMSEGTSFMARNDEIVRVSEELVAFPKTYDEELRSGTWATIRRGYKKFGSVKLHPVGASA